MTTPQTVWEVLEEAEKVAKASSSLFRDSERLSAEHAADSIRALRSRIPDAKILGPGEVAVPRVPTDVLIERLMHCHSSKIRDLYT